MKLLPPPITAHLGLKVRTMAVHDVLPLSERCALHLFLDVILCACVKKKEAVGNEP